MASEAVETAAPAANGDLHTEEDEKSKMRPADIDADMREMERRKRVEAIMNSRMFREELERIIETQIRDGGSGAAGLLQQLSDMMGVQPGRLQSASIFRGSSCVVPINDLRGVEAMAYTQAERLLRCKLAAACRLMDLHGWTSASAPAHVSARVSQSAEHFLVNPWGLLCHEITASSLVKLDMQGAIVEAGTTNFAVNAAAFQLHASIHAARPDVRCVIHLATPQAIAVSSLKTGLLPVCPAAAVLGEVPLHIESTTNLCDPAERDKLARALGPNSKVILLANRGAVCCGESVEEAFFLASNTATACDTQIKLAPLGLDNLILLPETTRRQLYDACRRAPPSASALAASQPASGENTATPTPGKDKPWRVGGLEFEALMRMLDNAGFRTGYLYRHPLVRGDPPRPRHDIEVPPAVSSLGFLLDQEGDLGPWRSKLADGRKTHDRSRWLNSPNVYQKVEILETGTPDPKKITKWVDANSTDEWVADGGGGGGGGGGGPGGGSPSHTAGGTPVRIEDALQFVPKNTDPKEFKRLQQQIKENRRADKITSGPQSHILEGVAWDEAKKLQDANMSATGDQVILMGAASKGIIQRGHQHNAMVYKTPYARNPFDAVTDEELDEYRRTVERRTKGEDEPQSESAPEDVTAPLKSPVTSPASETEDESRDEMRVLRIETKTAPMPSQPEVVLSDEFLQMEREYSQPPISVNKGENTYNGEDIDGAQSQSQSSREPGSPTKDVSTEDSPKKDKKKKKGLRTPSFLKKKKDKKSKLTEA